MKLKHSISKLDLNKRSIATLSSEQMSQIRGASISEIFMSSLKCIQTATVTIVMTHADCG